jgi:hypothetical protein
LVGASAFERGIATALLDVAPHVLISGGIVTGFFLASRRMQTLIERPVLSGAVYGIVVNLAKNFVVIPLSAVKQGA